MNAVNRVGHKDLRIQNKTLINRFLDRIRQNEEQLFLVLTLVIGVLVGLTIVAFVVLTERVGLRLYPQEEQRGDDWRCPSSDRC